nr:hypothetical protein [Tanacetum cinerariifolium]
MPKLLAIETMYPTLLHYLISYSFLSPNNSHYPVISKLSSQIVIRVSWRSIHILVFGVLRGYEVIVGRDDIYSTIDACTTAKDMWIAIERLQQDTYYQASKSHKSYAPSARTSSSNRSHATTINKGKDIAKTITPPSEENSDPKQAQRDKAMHKNLALIAKIVTVVGAKKTIGNHANQNAKECDDERVVLANLIANLKLETNENKKIQKQLKKANTSLAQELKEYKSLLEESNRTRDRYLGALHDKEIELAKYTRYNDCPIEKDSLTLEEKNYELVKQNSFTTSRYESLIKEKNNVIQDFKLKEEKDLEKLIAVEKQVKILNDIFYKSNQSIQIIHMLALKPSSSYNGGPSFANPKYLKKAQSEKPCLYEIPYDKDDLANIFSPDRKETLTLEQ